MNPVAWLFTESGFTPHAICLAWDPDVLTLALLGHAMIFIAYMAIPAQLVALALRHLNGADVIVSRRRWCVGLFATFILSCGIGHALDALDYFKAYYRFEAVWHVWTGLVSLATAAMMPFMIRISPGGRHAHANVAQQLNSLLELARVNPQAALRIAAITRPVRLPD